MAMTDDYAAQVLAGCAPCVAGELIETLATAKPAMAAAILRMLSLSGVGRAVDYMGLGTATSLLQAMPASEAARILSRADVRTGAGVIMSLPRAVSVQVIEAMPAEASGRPARLRQAGHGG